MRSWWPTPNSANLGPVSNPEARFPTGTLLAGRYRVVSLLGKGGMGEVYRCEDLTLGEAVALKLLPPELAEEREAHERFLDELRVARLVSHPAVCRVHDVGELEGQPFLTMEYVDGEDLASLLRRVGHLPSARAVEIAHQLCAGLAAAHEQGVLHRDLKPANVLIDGRGKARLADFGLAAVARRIEGAGAAVGTPAYMAPEQLAGEEASRQSDLWSLGLVLFELFTGRPAFEAKTLDQLKQLHHDSKPSPSHVLPDIDPAVDRVIGRCLTRDPARRPTSALEVSAALPGGDPLAAALAAGETPSPELVAASGGRGALPPWAAALCLAVVLACLIALGWVDRRMKLPELVRPELSVPVLRHRARGIAQQLGFDEPRDESHGLLQRVPQALADVEGEPVWRRLSEPLAGAVRYWYRASPGALVPMNRKGDVDWENPPQNLGGMVNLILAHDGNLLYLSAVPRSEWWLEDPFDWNELFQAAGLDPSHFQESAEDWVPRHAFTEIRSWRGSVPEIPDAEVVLRAAAWGGRPVHFQVSLRWDLPEVSGSTRAERVQGIYGWAGLIVQLLTLVGGVWLGARNLLQRKGDQRTAARVALAIFVISGAAWAFTTHHVLDVGLPTELQLLLEAAGDWLVNAALAWFLYMALEPTVRSVWPQKLVSWTRLLRGRWSDASVGRDLLLGLASGLGLRVLMSAQWLAVAETGSPLAQPAKVNSNLWMGVHEVLGALLGDLQGGASLALLTTFLFVFFRVLFRTSWGANVALLVLGLAYMPHAVIGPSAWVDVGFRLAQLAVVLLLLNGAGTLALWSAFFTLSAVASNSLGFNLEGWGNGPSATLLLLLLFVAIASAVLATRGDRST